MGGQETFGELNLGKEYFEGDVVLTEEQRKNIRNVWQDGNSQGKDLALTGFRQLWPNNTVPYTIATRMRKKNEIFVTYIQLFRKRLSHTSVKAYTTVPIAGIFGSNS